jgi:hypothetical protein
MAKCLKSGGWYRDRTCDPYHVKVCVIRYVYEIIGTKGVNVALSFLECCHQSWAIIGEELAGTS